MTADPNVRQRAPVLAVAVDLPSAPEALALADKLTNLPVWLKVGLELFTAEGPDLVKSLREKCFSIFLDLKFHDIPNTVRGAVRSASRTGARMLTLHVCGGEAMCRAAVEGRAEALAAGPGCAPRGDSPGGEPEVRDVPALRSPLLMGITVLTSEGTGRDRDALADLAVERALAAQQWGLDGVVCSGWEAAAIKKACGSGFLCLCPGIRFAGTEEPDDQARVCSPAQAVAAGADFLVMGRPVIRAADPALAALAALRNMGLLS